MTDDIDLRRPDLYINRELSLLEFNGRVLAQALDERLPLLERLRFLCIFSTNLDEFFEIRVARLQELQALGSTQAGPDQLGPTELLNAIGARVHEQVDIQYRILNDALLPALAAEGIRFVARGEWSAEQAAWVREYFDRELAPMLSPMGLDPAHPFPRVLNKSLNFIVALAGTDAFGRRSGNAVVQAPRSLPRIIPLPQAPAGQHHFVFLSSVIHAHVGELFPGMEVKGCYQFRVTRNSDLFVDEEEADDLLRAVEGELQSRRYGDAVRLEVADTCPQAMVDYLLAQVGLEPIDLYRVNGPVNLNRLLAVCDLPDRPDLRFAPFSPGLPAVLGRGGSIFAAIAKGDLLLHHPFQSFLPVVEFVQQAASDPDVLAIKQTLYRTGEASVIADALVAAARAGKEVTVVVELLARFDEEANIALANRLQEAGAHVVYGVVGYKTHAKMSLVLRREGRALRHYAHLGTGNYHPRTSRLYTDYGLFTCDPALTSDVQRVFLQLTSLGVVGRFEQLLEAPFTLHEALLGKIEREATHAAAGRPARIVVKLNSLVEPRIIQALYAACRAGVDIELVVRGMCALRPGVPGVSERIRVRSIVGRFLEHTRVLYFHNGGEPEVYLGSADWAERNFFRRVEVCFPILDAALRARVIDELELYLADNQQAWELQTDGSYRRVEAGDAPALSAQQALLERLAG
ncbi:polyphosphate kinase 1 [Immundisolibacter sp.]|uniref:polyphosphate kinase 1 n=1 Tax=Immundisolibacter sp. TaxID=1934948 RepID=UPI00260AAD80|nr:polyphosphate kinase 1 [Immundisolibacter sp.]MDD3650021.1 polyphosphate kinase 1 [Immundisolibacter sp.]